MNRRRSIAYAAAEEQPFSTINTTPMIDVMLVLLIMFILALPVMTHSVKIDLPTDGLGQKDPQTHRLNLDSASRVTWDGLPITEADLPARLSAFRQNRDDFLLFRVDAETRYEDFDRVLAHVKRAGVEQLGFDRNDRFAGAY
ncbi:MAG: biopolymer transport protein ExbD [Sphingomonadales bacterium]|nr:biopolymer transport protein ExbD [Sphingomonadales bacterium]